jgi:starch synthase
MPHLAAHTVLIADNLSPRVLFAVAELAPWMKTGGLGEVAATLPAALRAAGVDARILVPAYPGVRAALRATHAMAEVAQPGGKFPPTQVLAGATAAGVPVFAVDCPALYARSGDPYCDVLGRDWPDNHLRFGLLSRIAALIALGLPGLEWTPQLVHCNDWHTALAPAYLHFAGAAKVRSVFTIHNIAYQGIFPRDTLEQLALPARAFTLDGVEYHGMLSFLKAGIQYADALTTVSPTHASEIQGEELGFGLGGLLRQRAPVLSGILNGIDTEQWNPATDAYIAQCYDSGTLEAKAASKSALQRRLKLEVTDDMPLLGVVSRLTEQKGLDLLLATAREVLNLPAQLVVLGSGDKSLERQFAALARTERDRCAAIIGFDEALAHLIEAGADIFVMPSRYEPCGLNQMYSLRYGTPPVVRATGGLADTVVDCDESAFAAGSANGFVFSERTPQALLAALRRAVGTWHDRARWSMLQRNGMRRDFGWRTGAQRYCDLYRALIAAA